MKTFYGEGRVWGNAGVFVAHTNTMDEARDAIWRATSSKEQVQRPNLLKTATPKVEAILEAREEKGPDVRYDKSYQFTSNVTFLEFAEMSQFEEDKEDDDQ